MCFKNQGHHDRLKMAIARLETWVCSSGEEGECSLSVQQFSKQLQQANKWKYIKGNYSNMQCSAVHIPMSPDVLVVLTFVL